MDACEPHQRPSRLARFGVARLGLVLLLATAAPAQAASPDAGSSGLTPPSLVVNRPAKYPEALAGSGTQGTVTVHLLVDQKGKVEATELVKGVHPLLDQAALEAAKGLEFEPARMEGKPVPVWLPFDFHFVPPAPPAPSPSAGQAPTEPVRSAKLTGLVRAKGNRRPLVGATVQAEGAKGQVETGPDGRFSVDVTPTSQWVRISVPGYRPGAYREDLSDARALDVAYSLEALDVNPYETVVHGERSRTEVTRVRLREQEIREVAGTMGDPFRVVMLLPGVSSVVSGLAYPVVRGSSPASTGYFLDGIRIPLLFHLFVGPAVVHPDFIDGIDFYPGGPPARYGSILGGVVEGRTTQAREEQLRGSAYADFINAGGFLEYPIQATGTNFSLAGRISYTAWLVALAANALQPPAPAGQTNPRFVLDFHDYQARIEQRIARGSLRLFAFGSGDTVGAQPEAGDTTGFSVLQWVTFDRADLRFRYPIADGRLEVSATYGADKIGIDFKESTTTAFGAAVQQTSLIGKAGWSGKLAEGWELAVGAEADRRVADVALDLTLTPPGGGTAVPISERRPVAMGSVIGGFTELTFSPSDAWTFVAGGRFDNFHLVPGLDHQAVDPRVALKWQVVESFALKASGGRYHQQPTFLINLPVIDIAAIRFGLQEAWQLDVGAEWTLPVGGLQLQGDVYYNPMVRTLELSPFDDERLLLAQIGRGGTPDGTRIPDASSIFGDGSDYLSYGQAYGFEVMLRKPLSGRWFGWISYSLQKSERWAKYIDYDALGQYAGTKEGFLPYVFDQTHVLNVVASYRLPFNWTLGAAFHYNTGRPEIGGLTSHTNRETYDPALGRSRWVRADKDAVDRLPPFARLDARIAKAWVFDLFQIEAYFDFLNVTLANEVLGFGYLEEPVTRGSQALKLTKTPQALPIALPILGVKGSF